MISKLTDRGDANAIPDFRSVVWTLRASGVVVAAAILGVGWCGHVALERYSASLRVQHEAAVNSIRDADGIRAEYAGLKQQIEQTHLRRARAAERVPTAANEIEFLRQLSAIANESQLEISDFRPGATSEHATHSEMEFYIRANGSFASLCRFIDSMGDMPRVCRVSQMTVAAPTRADGVGQIELHIALAFGLKATSSI